MARKVSSSKSPEERRAQAEALQTSIATQVEQLRETEQWQRFLSFAQAFHAYSLNNVLLILSQNPTATRVAGFRTWQQLGRQVRKGERGIRIFGFRQKKLTNDSGDSGDTADDAQTSTDESGQKLVTYFPILSVFDIDQTDKSDPAAADPAAISQRLEGDEPRGILEATTDYLTRQGWNVEREAIRGEINGYTTTDGTRRVVIDASLSPAQAAKTALHEAAHVILHAEEDHTEYIEHRGIKETEAESVAYIVAGILKLDTTAYSIGYVAGWTAANPDTIRSTATRVLRAAHTLADALTTTDDTDDEADDAEASAA
ncbi:MAG: ArdC-like ssDNA-binding domain-containing protein [Rhodoglobus sp.]